MLKSRGDRLHLRAEKMGHLLKKAGLHTGRLGSAGNGLRMDSATQAILHEVATAYGCVGSIDDKENLHCPLCEQKQ
ncbi:MAG: hypothetical protein WCF30_09595 [Terracidiphilus sp.]